MSLRKEPAPSGSVPVDKCCQVGESSPVCCHAVPHSLDDDQSLPFWGACRLTPCSRGWGWGRKARECDGMCRKRSPEAGMCESCALGVVGEMQEEGAEKSRPGQGGLRTMTKPPK